MEIKTLVDISSEFKNSVLSDIEKIFFESSVITSFKDDETKQRFFHRWCGEYLQRWPDQVFLAIDAGRVLGYLTGCTDTESAVKVLDLESYTVFDSEFKDFPAHFHINCDPDARGKGVGAKLVASFCSSLKSQSIPGVFIITAPMARNSSFYMRVGFDYSYTNVLGSTRLLFMGKKL